MVATEPTLGTRSPGRADRPPCGNRRWLSIATACDVALRAAGGRIAVCL